MLFVRQAKALIAASFLIFISCVSLAQDIKPETAAQKMAEGNTSTNVNFNTGVMNYAIPLLSTSQDGYKIPVSLGYSAGGIKIDEAPGICGIGWALSYGGGIISRTIRGAYADEDRQNGILKHPIPATGSPDYEEFIKKVELGTTDGESDLFSLQVNGVQLHFFLKPSADTLIVEPLEQTNVKVRCQLDTFSTLKYIKEWTVIDEQGNLYRFTESVANVANVYNGVNTNGIRQSYIANWYLTSVECINNDKISFEYMPGDLLEMRNDAGVSYSRYGTHWLMNDFEAIQASLDALAFAIVGDEFRRNKVLQLISSLENQKEALTEHFFRTVNVIDPANEYSQALNFHLSTQYFSQLSDFNEAIDEVYADMNYSPELAPFLNNVIDAFSQIKEVQEQFKDFGQVNLYAQKLIKRIKLRNGIIDFDYVGTSYASGSTAKLVSIIYRTLAGDKIKEVRFSINEKGFLKDVNVLSAVQTLERNCSFTYFDEELSLSPFSQDYWGYYNGQPNESLLPSDPCYIIETTQHTSFPLFGPLVHPNYTYYENTSHPPGDRLPYPQFAKARTLKSITNHLGAITSFEYEGNDVFADFADRSVLTGGIRIKSIKTEDASGQLRKINYKYAFPLLNDPSKVRSTGQFSEWGTSGFTDMLGYSSGNDTYIYSHMNYRGTNCLPGGANGVFYHYVEEQAEDNSAIGYKYFALDPLISQGSHNNLLDGKLMAKISYDATGKIVYIQKYQYTTNFDGPGNRSNEFSFLYGRGIPYLIMDTNSTGLIRQYKKGGIYYDPNDVLTRYSGDPYEFINVGGMLLSVPSIGKNIYDHQYLRAGVKSGFGYELPANIFVHPTAFIAHTFSDYAPEEIPAIVANLPSNEKAYLYEKLLGSSVNRIEETTRYFYESAKVLQPTRIEKQDSKGRIKATKYKYVGDYDSGAAPFIAELKANSRNADIVETQQWLSADGGNSFKFLNGALVISEEKEAGGRKFVLPVEKYLYLPSEPIDLSTSGQSVSMTGPYSSVFWENQAFYKQEQTFRWQLNGQFARMKGEADRTAHFELATCYDSITGSPLIKAIGVDPNIIAASDIGPFISHGKYSTRGWFKNAIPVADPVVYTFSQKPFLNGLQHPFFDYVTYSTGALQMIDLWWADQGMSIPLSLLQHPLMTAYNNLFQSIENKVELNLFISDMHAYRKEMAALSSGSDFMNDAMTYLGADFLEMSLALQAIESLCLPDFSNYEKQIVAIPEFIHPPLSTPLDVERALLTSNLLDIYVVKDEFSNTGLIQYRIRYRNGSISGLHQIQPDVLNDRIGRATLNLTTISNYTDAVEVQFLSSRSCYAVPQGVVFEAYAYLPDNSLMLSFNHTGRYSERVYNEFGEKEQVTDNKDITRVNRISYEGKGDTVPSDVVVVKIVNESNDMETGPVIKSILLKKTYVVTESKVLVIPGQEHFFYASKDMYTLAVNAETPFKKIKINGVEHNFSPSGTLGMEVNVDLRIANELLIQILAD